MTKSVKDGRFTIEVGAIRVFDETAENKTEPTLENKGYIERDVSPRAMLGFLKGLNQLFGGRLDAQIAKLEEED